MARSFLRIEFFSSLFFPDEEQEDAGAEGPEQGIPVIAVRENRNRMKNELERLGSLGDKFAAGKLFIAENYPEAVGIMTALRKGAALSSARRH